jgi:hypothetical protein
MYGANLLNIEGQMTEGEQRETGTRRSRARGIHHRHADKSMKTVRHIGRAVASTGSAAPAYRVDLHAGAHELVADEPARNRHVRSGAPR